MHLSETISSGFFFLAPWLVFAPVTGLLINLIFGRQFSEKVIGTVASLASGAAFVVSVLLAYSVSINHGEMVSVPFAEWIHIGTLQLDWTFRVDSLSTTMMLVVSGVGTLIHIYAIGYMHEDVRFKNDEGRFNRFFIFLNLFIAAMMILVSGDSFMMLFVGWEGVGLCSFLLIGFWYEMDTLGRPSWANSNAAKKAFIVNRIGDFGFLIAGLLMFWYLGSFQFDAVFAAAPAVAESAPWVIVAITLFMLVGVAGKSAQIPLYVWLPDAMAGPTPVSALIHAATMVTAGVYLITRSAPLTRLCLRLSILWQWSARELRSSPRQLQSDNMTSRKFWLIPPFHSLASWLPRLGWARTRQDVPSHCTRLLQGFALPLSGFGHSGT